ncbi:MAG: tRNA (adenosine(37)-N6)-dimethylallyltransferase MiaA [Anaerolineaceae bacterium]
MDNRPPLIVILGPTAVGKTELSLRLAERFGGEIVSADSRLFYRGMDIGTAKPTLAERRRVPHHLIDVSNPDQTWSLSVFQAEAKQVIADIHARGKLPFLVGGTGQYITAVTDNWIPPAQAPDERLRKALEDWAAEVGKLGLYERLAVLDPEAAKKIDYHNVRRTIRALEVIFKTGKKFSEQRQKTSSPYRVLKLGLDRPRDELYQRVDARIAQMLADGFAGEVHKLLDAGYAANLPTMSAIGYREMCAYLQGTMSLDEAVAQMKRLTRVYVRRQGTWFKEDAADITWLVMSDQVEEEAVAKIQQFLEN